MRSPTTPSTVAPSRDGQAALAVIPARGGSKRLPGKNLRPLAGRPALALAIEAALESGVFARVVVSTDCDEIAAVARASGADVPFRREARLADDMTPISVATADALDRIDPDATRYPLVAQLMANCPLRSADDVRDSHAAFVRSGAPAQLSVVRFGWQNPWWAMRVHADQVLEPLFPTAFRARGQDLAPLVCVTGAIWWAESAVIRRTRTFHVPGRTAWELPWTRGIDVDTAEDWELAEWAAARARTARVRPDVGEVAHAR
jgi:CMP-N-acetylneuraminic acid synthetase